MATYVGQNGFTCEFFERPGSPRVHIEADRSSATRILDVDWADAAKFAQSLVGYSTTPALFGSTWYLQRYVPHEFPWDAFLGGGGGSSLRAVKASIEPIPGAAPNYSDAYAGGDSEGTSPEQAFRVATYDKARVNVVYETLPYDVWTDAGMQSKTNNRDEADLIRYVSKVVAPAGQYLTLPVQAFRFVDPDDPTAGDNNAGKPIAQGVGRMLVHYNLSLTWYAIPEAYVPCAAARPYFLVSAGPQAIDTTIGKVNATTFAGYSKGTLLLMAVTLKPYRSAFGQRIYDITYMFKYFEPLTGKGHNHILRHRTAPSASLIWYEVTVDGNTNLVAQTNGKSVYDFAEFKNLFRPATV